jgi:hypothetical protein
MKCTCDPNCAFPSDGGCGYEGSISFCHHHAAAPELLEALEAAAETIKALDEDYDMHPVYIAARAAIAKARGESR